MKFHRIWPFLLASFLPVFSEESSQTSASTSTAIRPETCFHRPPEHCPDKGAYCRCKRLEGDPKAVICCNVSSSFHLREGIGCLSEKCNSKNCSNNTLSRIHIYNATLNEFNITAELANLRSVESMSVTDGKIDRIIGEFKKHVGIRCLNFSNNGINNITNKRSFVHLHKLDLLDLSHNNLSEVPNFSKSRVFYMDISGNPPLMCRSLMDAMNNTELHFVRSNETYCLFPQTFNWFNVTELIPLKHLETYYDLEKKSCSDNCTCKAQRLDLVAGKPPTFAVMVDCSGKQMTEMPTKLPPNTIALNISNNNITKLTFQTDIYENIRELDADNNQIEEITTLEGTKFLDTFVLLSLRNNHIKKIPTYLLSNILDRNSISRNIYLGHNRLTCDCTTAKNLKVWLLTRHKNIPDYQEIMCNNLKDVKVIQLEQAKMCQHQDEQEWTDYIYYIISAEVLLLVCLVLKVSYDYWVFKTAGYLPWPASKMPKLPCDWLCE